MDSSCTRDTPHALSPRSSSQTQSQPPLFRVHTLVENIARYTTHLTVDSHTHTMCASLVSLDIPNLESLRIHPLWKQPDFMDPAGIPTPSQPCNENCTLLASIHPRRLVLGGEHSEMLSISIAALMSLPQAGHASTLRAGLEEIMIIIHDDEEFGSRSGRWGGDGDSAFHGLPATVERLVLVMASCAGTWTRWGQGWGFEMDPPQTAKPSLNPPQVRRNMAKVCCGRVRVIEVIGLETMSDMLNEKSVERGQREFREGLKGRLMGKGWAAMKADERVEGVIFTSAS